MVSAVNHGYLTDSQKNICSFIKSKIGKATILFYNGKYAKVPLLGLTEWSRDLKKHDWKMVRKICEYMKTTWKDLFKWTQDMRLFLSHVNTYQKVTLAEKFNNRIDSMTHSVQSTFLCSSLFVTAQGPWTTWLWWSNGLTRRTSTWQGWLSIAAECQIIKQQRSTLSP